ncbi:MAG: hypothetical protein U0736_17435 [Gemmataceae bacterium]
MLREARELVADGVRELIVVAQDTTTTASTCTARCAWPNCCGSWMRSDGLDCVLYAYPAYFTDELIDTLAGANKILPYLDMPLQHINDRMLRRMQRRVTGVHRGTARPAAAGDAEPDAADHVHRRLPR